MKIYRSRMMVQYESTRARLKSGENNVAVVIHRATLQDYFRDGIQTQISDHRA